MKQLKKYFALTRLGILETIQWRLALIVMVLGNLLYLTLIYFLWKAIFASAGTDVVNGMTFEMTMVYLVLATSLYGVVELYIVWEIGRNIQNGKISLDLIRPIKYKQYVFWENSGTLVVNFYSYIYHCWVNDKWNSSNRMEFGLFSYSICIFNNN